MAAISSSPSGRAPITSYRITYKDSHEPYAMPIDLIDNFDNEYSFIDNDGPIFYFKTDLEAPRGRVIAIDIRKPERDNWKEIIPEAKENLSGVGLVGNLFVARYFKDARTQVKLFAHGRARSSARSSCPGIGTAGGFGGKRTDTETFYSFSSFATPPSIYRYDLLTGKSKLIRQSKVEVQSGRLRGQAGLLHEQGRHESADVHHSKKGIKLDGSQSDAAVRLRRFQHLADAGVSRSARVAWLEMGGVYAQANLRGGGEYGKEWHKAGTKLHKQNVFDDFIAAARVADRQQVHAAGQAGHPGRQQRRSARRRRA